MKKLITLLVVCLIVPVFVLAELVLPAQFSDGMVLQREINVSVWGKADPDTSVTVSFAGKTAKGKSDKDGKWMVQLKPLNACSKGDVMTITAGADTKKINDVLVGEVWVCSGQSNMDFTLNSLRGNARDPKDQPIADAITKEVETAKDPLLRQIAVPHKTSHFEELDNFSGTWIKCEPGSTGNFTGTGYYFGKELRAKLNVPVGLLKCPWGGKRVEPFTPREAFKSSPALEEYYQEQIELIKKQLANAGNIQEENKKMVQKWQEAVKKAKAENKKQPRRPRGKQDPKTSTDVPATLYNAMIHPLIPYAIRGAIWYQGESNTGHFPEQYSVRMQALIKGWRKAWDQGDFPFIQCQLASFRDPADEPLEEDSWATICDQQRRSLELKNTGIAVLNDIGASKNIHPKNKIDAGKRLARWALKETYGQDIKGHSSPLYKSHKIKGSKVIIEFDYVGSGLMVGNKPVMKETVEVDEPLKAFQICGADRQWKWADAKIVGKDEVEVSHKDISEPGEVRYAWSAFSKGSNLYNKEGLPASIFTTAK